MRIVTYVNYASKTIWDAGKGIYRGGSRGRVQGVRTPPEMAKAFFFVFAIKILRPVTGQLRHFLVVHPS